MRLRVYYDGSAEASVDAPLGDFFAVGHGFERGVDSSMIRASSDGRARNSYWPMPFARSCRITLTNEGRSSVDHLYYHVDWEKLPSLPPGTAYFHARYRQELPAPDDGQAVRVSRRQGARLLRRHGPVGRPARGGMVRRGRRPFLRRRREEAFAHGNGLGGLLHRRVGPPRHQRPVRGRHGRRRHRARKRG